MALVVAVGCGGRDVTEPMSPDGVSGANKAVFSSESSSPRSGDLVVTKECSEYTGLAGSFCTITSSNLKAIEVGSRVVYTSAADFGAGLVDSDAILYPPGPGNNTAFGHVVLNLGTGLGTVTFSGGTGKFTLFHASADVSYLGGPNWAWDGTYSYGR
jgi:hypothetical protein